MDFKALLPDFNAIKNTDWTKPQVDTKDTLSLVTLGCIALMLIFVFLPWFSMTAEGETASRLGITTVCGIFGFILTLAAAAGAVTQLRAFATCYQEIVEAIMTGKELPEVLDSVLQPHVEVYKKNLKPQADGKDVVVAGRIS